jgi:hypothetical protein
MRVQRVHPGFDTDQTLSFRVALPDTRYGERAQRITFYNRLLTRLGALPGVASAGAVMGLPLSNVNFNISFHVKGRPDSPPGQEPSMEVRVASPEYFRTIGIPLKRGRLFTSSDRHDGAAGRAAERVGGQALLPERESAGGRSSSGGISTTTGKRAGKWSGLLAT